MKSFFKLIIVQIFLVVQMFTRITLAGYGLYNDQVKYSELPMIFFFGFLHDLISLCYFLAPFLCLSLILRKILSRKNRFYNVLTISAYCFFIAIFLLTGLSELIFWDEFGTRFNFIAVDYLVYTHEIIGTMNESLPLPLIAFCVITLVLLIIIYLKNSILKNIKNFSYQSNISCLIIALVVSCLSFYAFNSSKLEVPNRYASALNKNGLYELFSAFRNNSLDYEMFYSRIDDKLASKILRSKVLQNNQTFLNDTDDNIERDTRPWVDSSVQEKKLSDKKYNVVLIVVESLSARFLTHFGNHENITPYLDRLVKDSVLFTKLYATGTRTVRGLEAITLATVALPGSSIVRRPDNANLFNIATIFRAHEYDVSFILGGYSYFDNLQNYFTSNGYKVIDRSDFSSDEISFSNIWGIADEDVFNKVIEYGDKSVSNGRNFFSIMLTTSNHRPYTFPDGRIDLKSGSGRNAAVKYTDYSIGKFIEEAQKHSWFDDTIFVITADHCAVGTGKIDLPVTKYHIPLIIYAPKIIQPKIIDNLVSQIDIAPTVINLALPQSSYKSKFIGQDILHTNPNRAFVSTYQLLGYITDEHLVILSPNHHISTYKLSGEEQLKVENTDILSNEAISFYQSAYNFYTKGKMRQ